MDNMRITKYSFHYTYTKKVKRYCPHKKEGENWRQEDFLCLEVKMMMMMMIIIMIMRNLLQQITFISVLNYFIS
jgi:hypothetical protein